MVIIFASFLFLWQEICLKEPAYQMSITNMSTSIRSLWPAMANPLASRPKEWPTCTS